MVQVHLLCRHSVAIPQKVLLSDSLQLQGAAVAAALEE
jgi:hypothetical protein